MGGEVMDSLGVMLEAVEKYMGEQFTDMLEEAVTDARTGPPPGLAPGPRHGWSPSMTVRIRNDERAAVMAALEDEYDSPEAAAKASSSW
jgi:hypothetical protein